MKNIFRSNLFSLIIILLQIILATFIGFISKTHNFSTTQLLIFSDIFILLIPIIIYFIITKYPVKRTLRLNKPSIYAIIISIILGFLFIPIGSFLGMITSLFFKNNVVNVMNKLSVSSSITFFIIVALLPAIFEELAVRGVVLGGYRSVSIHKAAIITGLIFALFHMNPPQFLYTFVLGIILAYLVYYTNSIFSSMIVHFIFNGFNSLAFLYIKSTNPKLIEKSANSSQSLSIIVTYFIIALMCTVAIIRLLKYLKNIHEKHDYSTRNENEYNYMSDSQCYSKARAFKAYLPLYISIAIFLAFSIFMQIMNRLK
ncbi:CAAX amino terminal protease self- immunity [Clostridium tepidiprofundi DSM 19306]|uniref:CAAX amino terminal protease self-immunity n=1 Tax=Clostridium tepidiprofundi DSM 19306 TaxID=1121338 RepID=A0A151B6C5_9CLOT|nr:CPBP family intramembrane glutamic endopeptidase [Clostridium tepidiprofundi]KYH35478.1 CAAX amino terminal protease self- immunity [Clostridium tepidiprofundi DSM 19306]